MRVEVTIDINNMPAKHGHFIVVRNVEGTLWYYASWNEKEKAEQMAEEVDGIVVEDCERSNNERIL